MFKNRKLVRHSLASIAVLTLGVGSLAIAERSLTLQVKLPDVTDPQRAALLTQAIADQFPNKVKYEVTGVTGLGGSTITLIKHGIYDVYWVGGGSSQSCSTNNPDWTLSKGVPETFTVSCAQGDQRTNYVNTITLNLVTPQNPRPSLTIDTYYLLKIPHRPAPPYHWVQTYPCSIGQSTYGIKNVSPTQSKQLYWAGTTNYNGFLTVTSGCSFPAVQ